MTNCVSWYNTIFVFTLLANLKVLVYLSAFCICVHLHLCICVLAANIFHPPPVCGLRKRDYCQSAFSMIYTFATSASSVWISFNELPLLSHQMFFWNTPSERKYSRGQKEHKTRLQCPTRKACLWDLSIACGARHKNRDCSTYMCALWMSIIGHDARMWQHHVWDRNDGRLCW